MRILLIGPLNAPPGGATVLFNILVEELNEKVSEVSVKVINTTNTKKYQIPSLYLKIFWMTLKSDVVSLHISPSGLAGVFISPLLLVITRLFKKKWITRLFAGDFYDVILSSGFIKRFIYREIIFKSDLLLVETKELFNKLSPIHPRVKWFANHRKSENIKAAVGLDKTLPLKIVFVSHVSPQKGILELIEASKQLDGVVIDVYGPFYDGLNEKIFDEGNISYKGIVDPLDVPRILADYHVLILPSYQEGYPGIVIEAMSVGLAIICTALDSLKEMLVEGEDAIMIPPKDVGKIIEAVKFLNEDRLALEKFQNKSLEKFWEYDSKFWAEKFIQYSKNLF